MTVGGQPQVAYGYDNADRLTSITQGAQAVGFGYDNIDRQTSQTLPGGITTDYAYDNASQLTEITHKAGASTLGNLSYTYDLGGRRNSVNGSFARTALPAALSSATYDAGNRLKTWGSTALTYDNAGNLTADGTQNYTWNSRGELASISGASTASFAYDAFGRRSKATIAGVATDYHYDGADVVQELSGTTPKANLLGGLGMDQRFTRTDSTGTKSYLTDALGSTVALADQTGALQTQYTYEPFGKTTQSGPASTNSFQFTGRENDGTGLDYNRTRYYNPTFGRFISEDPMGFAAGDPNLYGYVGNSPVTFTDPSGMFLPLVAACLGGAAFNAGFELVQGALSGRKVTVGNVLGSAGIGCAAGLAGFGLGSVLGSLAERALPSAQRAAELIRAANPVDSALKSDIYHRAASWAVDDVAAKGSVFRITGYDGVRRLLIQVPGGLNDLAGRFEWILEASGDLTHQLFVKGGTINGIPIIP
jgi:RHS repeat-associated protein